MITNFSLWRSIRKSVFSGQESCGWRDRRSPGSSDGRLRLFCPCISRILLGPGSQLIWPDTNFVTKTHITSPSLTFWPTGGRLFRHAGTFHWLSARRMWTHQYTVARVISVPFFRAPVRPQVTNSQLKLPFVQRSIKELDEMFHQDISRRLYYRWVNPFWPRRFWWIQPFSVVLRLFIPDCLVRRPHHKSNLS